MSYRSFSVERANNARINDTIQNLMMTLDSLQPSSSKWWCKGAILKMRLPRILKRRNLDHDREGFRYEDASYENQQQFLLDDDGDGSDSAPESEGTDVSHEHLAGCALYQRKPRLAPTIEPQKIVSSPACRI